MKRAAKVCWIGFVFSTIVVAAVGGLLIYFTAFRNSGSLASPTSGSDGLEPIAGGDSDDGGPVADADESETSLIDHLAHAVPGFEYHEVDYDGDGFADVQLDGSRSHTHYFDEGPPVVIGRLVEKTWFSNDTKEPLAKTTSPLIKFPVGLTVVGLTVSDNFRDSHTGYAKVIVSTPLTDGAYCYYYPRDASASLALSPDVNSGARPTFGAAVKSIDFSDSADFPGAVSGNEFQARCVFVLEGGRSTTFSVDHFGPIRLLNGNSVVLESDSTSDETTSASYDLPEGQQSFDLLYYRASSSGAKLELKDGGDGSQYDLSRLLPILTKLDPITSTLEGGGSAKLEGINLRNGVKVQFGSRELQVDAELSTDDEVFVTVPPVKVAEVVNVRATNKAGSSNSLSFQYASDGRPPVKFTESRVMKSGGGVFDLALITGIKYGPDHRMYATGVNNRVHSFAIDRQMRASGLCTSPPLGEFRSILGLAFNPADRSFKLYVSASVLDWKSKERLTAPDSWANGQILLIGKDVGGECLNKVGDPVITGLPVTDHDHGVNGLVFDNDGRLHIQVGGFTNAGHNDASSRLGGIDENPLSSASLIAPVNAPGFNGRITYDSTDPSTARQTGGDVSVFSPGWRNSFGINIHSNGFLYATDNGASTGFGDKSVSCTKFERLGGQNLDDKLGKVLEGRYAGHPNRNRGRDDPAQCVFRDTQERSDGNYLAPLATFESSTDGVVEYSANVFGGSLKGDLLCSKYSTDESAGKVFRVQLDGDGELADGPDELWPASGLSIEMSPWGHVMMPRLYKEEIMVLTPQYSVGILPIFIAVAPARGPAGGGNVVLVTGHNFGGSPVALFGGKECTEVDVDASGGSFRCKVPAGSGAVEVVVRVGEGRVTEGNGVDYRYMNV